MKIELANTLRLKKFQKIKNRETKIVVLKIRGLKFRLN